MELEGLLADGGSESEIISALQEKVHLTAHRDVHFSQVSLIIQVSITDY